MTFRTMTFAELEHTKQEERVKRSRGKYTKQLWDFLESGKESAEIIAEKGSKQEAIPFYLHKSVGATINLSKYFKERLKVKSISTYRVMVIRKGATADDR